MKGDNKIVNAQYMSVAPKKAAERPFTETGKQVASELPLNFLFDFILCLYNLGISFWLPIAIGFYPWAIGRSRIIASLKLLLILTKEEMKNT